MARKSSIVIVSVAICLTFLTEFDVQAVHNDGRNDDGTLMQFEFDNAAYYGPSGWTKNIEPSDKTSPSEKKKISLTAQRIAPLDKRVYEKNSCKSNWLSPINIVTKDVQAPELGKQENAQEGHDEDFPETLIISTTEKEIEKQTWIFGHPMENYNGIEVRSPNVGMMQLMDNFDPIGKTDSFVTYDFSFLTIYYCNLEESYDLDRSMHQIDGKRFPVELHFVFMRKHGGNPELFTRDTTAVGKSTKEEEEVGTHVHITPEYIRDENIAVIVAVIGELSNYTNPYLQPLVRAAKNFRGKDFYDDQIDETNKVVIEKPWAPTWLLPDGSAYYYYDEGSFPVPPCWKVSRYYILTEKINISREQLKAFTEIRTQRESKNDGVLACTHSVLQDEILPGEVTLNLIEFVLNGNDHRPRSEEETKQWEARKKKMDIFRKRMKGVAVLEDDEHANGATGKMFCKLSLIVLALNFVLCCLHTLYLNVGS